MTCNSHLNRVQYKEKTVQHGHTKTFWFVSLVASTNYSAAGTCSINIHTKIHGALEHFSPAKLAYDWTSCPFWGRGLNSEFTQQGPVARSLVSANRWLRGIKMYRFPWYLTLVSTNHASSNPGLEDRLRKRRQNVWVWQTSRGYLRVLGCFVGISLNTIEELKRTCFTA